MSKKLSVNQKIFNKAYRGLMRQKERSYGNGSCGYRSGKLRCGIGFCITNDNYNPEYEGQSADNDMVMQSIADSIECSLSDLDERFLLDVQGIHDDYEPKSWKKEFKELSKEYNLKVPKLKS